MSLWGRDRRRPATDDDEDDSSYTALQLAAEKGHAEAVRVLMQHEASAGQLFLLLGTRDIFPMKSKNVQQAILHKLVAYTANDLSPFWHDYKTLELKVKSIHTNYPLIVLINH